MDDIDLSDPLLNLPPPSTPGPHIILPRLVVTPHPDPGFVSLSVAHNEPTNPDGTPTFFNLPEPNDASLYRIPAPWPSTPVGQVHCIELYNLTSFDMHEFIVNYKSAFNVVGVKEIGKRPHYQMQVRLRGGQVRAFLMDAVYYPIPYKVDWAMRGLIRTGVTAYFRKDEEFLACIEDEEADRPLREVKYPEARMTENLAPWSLCRCSKLEYTSVEELEEAAANLEAATTLAELSNADGSDYGHD